jgi:hypothetical protein
MALPDPILRNREGCYAQEKMAMLKDVETSTETVFAFERRTKVGVEDGRGTSVVGIGITNPLVGRNCHQVERAAQRRTGCSLLAGERPS